MATKRRKVWLQITTGADEGFVEEHRFRASLSKEKGYAPFIERLPGDVVLSREEVKRLTELIEDEWHDDGRDADREREIRALLRGRR